MKKTVLKFFQSEKSAKFIRSAIFVLAFLLTMNLVAVNFIELNYLIMADIFVFFLLLVYFFTDTAFYLMIFLYPFLNFQFVFGELNAPYVDILATLIFAVWALKKIINWRKEKPRWQDFPGLILILLFFISGGLSFINTEYFTVSLKYLFRPLMFFYFAFIVLPYNLIKNKKQLNRIYKIFFAVGVLVALIGILSIFITPGQWYSKVAQPVSFGGFEPIGGNQNAIAEILVVTLPISLIVLSRAKGYQRQSWILLGIILMFFVLLITLSRSGWLSILLELLLLFYLIYRPKIKSSFVVAFLIIFIILPLVLYFSVWQNVSWVQTSNLNRWLLTEISFNHFLQHPVIGNGLNSFQSLVADTFVYTVEFADPLDSHGFIQKIITEQGLIGIISFFGFLFYLFYRYVTAYLSERTTTEKLALVCLLMMLGGIVFFQLFSTSYYVSRMWLPIGVGLAAVRIYSSKKKA